jgi:hypothetical protein
LTLRCSPNLRKERSARESLIPVENITRNAQILRNLKVASQKPSMRLKMQRLSMPEIMVIKLNMNTIELHKELFRAMKSPDSTGNASNSSRGRLRE